MTVKTDKVLHPIFHAAQYEFIAECLAKVRVTTLIDPNCILYMLNFLAAEFKKDNKNFRPKQFITYYKKCESLYACKLFTSRKGLL